MIKKGDIIDLDIKDFAFGGKGIGKIKLDNKDYIIFVTIYEFSTNFFKNSSLLYRSLILTISAGLYL